MKAQLREGGINQGLHRTVPEPYPGPRAYGRDPAGPVVQASPCLSEVTGRFGVRVSTQTPDGTELFGHLTPDEAVRLAESLLIHARQARAGNGAGGSTDVEEDRREGDDAPAASAVPCD
jgi:hypothetical protein